MEISPRPLWWLEPWREPPAVTALPNKIDALVIGSGYCGLSAALTLARAGRKVTIIDANQAGGGASTLNAGFLGYELKSGLLGLTRRFGETLAGTCQRL